MTANGKIVRTCRTSAFECIGTNPDQKRRRQNNKKDDDARLAHLGRMLTHHWILMKDQKKPLSQIQELKFFWINHVVECWRCNTIFWSKRRQGTGGKDAIILERIARLLQPGLSTVTGCWKCVIDDFDQQYYLFLPHESFNYQVKYQYVSLALRYALEEMPAKTWLDCCKDAVDNINHQTNGEWSMFGVKK